MQSGLGLTPLQRSTGGKQKLGATSKMGERTLNRPTGCPAQRLADAGERIGFQGDSCTLSILSLDKGHDDLMPGGWIVGIADHFSREAIAVFLGE
jgi:hypothetical protein